MSNAPRLQALLHSAKDAGLGPDRLVERMGESEHALKRSKLYELLNGDVTVVPTAGQLRALADAARIPWPILRNAALQDFGYTDEQVANEEISPQALAIAGVVDDLDEWTRQGLLQVIRQIVDTFGATRRNQDGGIDAWKADLAFPHQGSVMLQTKTSSPDDVDIVAAQVLGNHALVDDLRSHGVYRLLISYGDELLEAAEYDLTEAPADFARAAKRKTRPTMRERIDAGEEPR